ncbi:MAG: non-homologous end-joining DNA ligase, partial [Terriglobales bacterium]
EDHPLEYLTFEGAIPEGNYGAGEVIVWDTGDYEPVGDTPPVKQLEQGHLKFQLHGKKLQGEFVLAHMASRAQRTDSAARPRAENAWLLIKKPDAAAAFGDTAALHPGSVLGRRRPRTQPVNPQASQLNFHPMLATLAQSAFSDPDWIFEIKWDGIRASGQCSARHARFVSRSGRDLTAQFPELAAPPFSADAVLDGEIVALDAEGKSSFHRLQQRMNLASPPKVAAAAANIAVVYYAFDLLALRGRDLTGSPLLDRKRELARLLARAPKDSPWRYSDHVRGDGVGLMELARARGLEGIVAKRAASRYEAGRSRQWLKFKLRHRQEAVVAGYTDPQGSRTDFGALVLALYEPSAKRFVYAGRVGTGFDSDTRRDLLARMQPVDRPGLTGVPGSVHWVEPKLVVEIAFAEWTPDGRMRAPVFLGLRTDKPPRDCVRELPLPAARSNHA